MNSIDNDYYYDVLFTEDHKKAQKQMSFADMQFNSRSVSGQEEIKQTMADIGELLAQIYENSHSSSQLGSLDLLQNEGVFVEESYNETKISEDSSYFFETNIRSILKNKEQAQNDSHCESQSNTLIDTLNSATDKIIQSLQGLSVHIKENPNRVKHHNTTPLSINTNIVNSQIDKSKKEKQISYKTGQENTVVSRLYQHQKAKEEKIQQLRADRERQEGKQRQPKTNRQVTSGMRVPLVKRVEKILEDKQKWVVEQQKKKFIQEEQYYKSLTFQPQLTSVVDSTDQCFIANQKQWLQKKNENLMHLKLEQEFGQHSFRPQMCQKSQEMLLKKVSSRQYDSNLTKAQFASDQASEQILKNKYPSNRSERGETVNLYQNMTSDTQIKRFNSLGRQNKENH